MVATAAQVAQPKRAAVGERKRRKFLECLRDGQSVVKSAAAVGVARRTVYHWREADPDFAHEWDEAYEQGTDFLEDVLQDKALTSDQPAFLIFALKGRRPTKYRDNVRHEIDAKLTVTVSDARAELAARFDQIASHRQAAIDGNARQLEPAPTSTPSTSVA
jgi:hypothetical protein